ncbi:NADH-ubiquinone oxidoreductase complex i, 21 kDa subunit [Hirsutella rhossiliensis]|uniref:NADH-ubiquinone oxidoreductase complex i, 21 kDa subunit domain-containing protein n=1 Tax=Hirsutella rhossiliensis TaxID=111463 RepID=A0A9P8MMG7_9HYPO|nr:NADH-ubiquinone oxidoreductase complex i, 21 kDa subunit domain-containing protein [Hirsutella rhossiliensis]KAH0958933.1 NADH-ubiquinone oxidoreductase complex i, 21 kDa subunit domain-containing protein [Hirsutella rhossiliensis]
MADTTTKQNPASYVGVSKVVETDYPLIDNDPHFKRVVGYARTSDYVAGATAAAFGPAALLTLERFAPSHVGKGGFAKAMRLAGFIGLAGGFLYFYQRSCLRLYGATENAREVEMDMREMVDKVKAGQPLYGESKLSPYLQGVAARQSRYSALFFSAIPWFNFVNHNQHGVDTAKYYQQAERELEAERTSKGQ